MAELIKIKRGFTAGIEPFGLTLGELAANLADQKLFIGGTYGNAIPLGGGGIATNIPQASDSITGVASFNPAYFVVGSTGVVSLTSGYQVTGDTVIAGTNITISRVGNAVTVNSTASGGGSVSLATNSITGVASFTASDFSVSPLGMVSLTGGIVRSFNGLTGSVIYAPSLATTSLTGVASFSPTYFSVAANGTVSLVSAYQVTGDTVVAGTNVNISRSGNSVTVNSTQPLATSSVTGVASFTNNFVVSALGAVGLTSNIVNTVNGRTGNVGLPLATSSITGIASFGNEFVVSSLGAVSLTGNYVRSFNGATGSVVYAPPIASSSVTGVASFTNNFVVSALGAVGLTSNIVNTVNGRTGNVGLPLATTSITGVASFNLSHFSVSSTGNVSLISSPINYTFSNDFVVDGSFVSLTSDIVRSFNGLVGNVTYSPRLATNSLTGVASFTNEFVVSSLGAVSLTGNYVRSFNGATGSVVYAPPLASTSVTGVASFNSTHFSVAGNGAVSLAAAYQVTGDTIVAGSNIIVSKVGNTATVSLTGGFGKFTYGSIAPISATAGDQWFNSTYGTYLIYIDDGNSTQWVEIGGGGGASDSSIARTLLFSGF